MQATGLPRRLAAMLYDALLIFAFLVLLAVVAVALLGGQSVHAGGPVFVAGYNIVRFLTVYLFFTGYWAYRGRTLGMQSWRLQLESLDGGTVSFARASVRFFAALLSWLPAGLGFLWQLWDAERLTWHDRISGTRIVHYPKKASPER